MLNLDGLLTKVYKLHSVPICYDSSKSVGILQTFSLAMVAVWKRSRGASPSLQSSG
jgi:hypothetical protein